MNKRIILYLILTIISMLIIFTFSSKNSDSSNSTSKRLIDGGITIYENITNKKVNHKKIINKLNYPVRKVAHFTLYLILGFFVYEFLLLTSIPHKETITILLCFIYSLTDEIHQLFVSGRTGQIIDIIIDTMGAITIVLIYKYIIKRKNSLQ